MEEMPEEKANELRFIELVYSFQQLAMVGLGKLVNPATNKADRHLPQAKAMIDTLRMLRAKSQGNLSETERKLIEQVILTLELNYADETSKKTPEASSATEETQKPA